MRLTEKWGKDFIRLCRTKYDNINNRCNNRTSYIEKNISNSFTWHEFVEYAARNGLKPSYHCHRPNRTSNYEPGNLVFIPANEHYKISALEKRKLSPVQVSEIHCLSERKSLRQLGRLYNVSHQTIFNILKREGYYGMD